MAVDLGTENDPINPDDPKYATMLANLQGNILKGHGRGNTVHIFIEFTAPEATVRQQLVQLGTNVVTSAKQQHIETQQFKTLAIPGGLFGGLYLTAKGYRALGFTAAQLDSLFVEAPDPINTTHATFKDGMQAHGAELNDPVPANWDDGYQSGAIDAMILLADADLDFLLRRARDIINQLVQFSNILAVERGKALKTDQGEGIEHFGYVDGRSQPIFYEPDLADEGLTDQWNPGEPLRLVLVPDPATSAVDAFGSYFVFRKLEQDVRRFTVREHELADQLGLVGQDRERAGAMAVGRFRDGTPLTLSQTDGFIPVKENNFTFANDAQGAKCPFHAHIRKTNPRGDTVRIRGSTDEAERARRIARRGIPYGERNRDPNEFQALDDLPTGGVGLLFMCFQASITRQFAFIQHSWVENANFVNPNTGPDPIIAQKKPAGPGQQQWPLDWNNPPAGTQAESFGNFVTMKGGEFFFAPSIPFLKSL